MIALHFLDGKMFSAFWAYSTLRFVCLALLVIVKLTEIQFLGTDAIGKKILVNAFFVLNLFVSHQRCDFLLQILRVVRLRAEFLVEPPPCQPFHLSSVFRKIRLNPIDYSLEMQPQPGSIPIALMDGHVIFNVFVFFRVDNPFDCGSQIFLPIRTSVKIGRTYFLRNTSGFGEITLRIRNPRPRIDGIAHLLFG